MGTEPIRFFRNRLPGLLLLIICGMQVAVFVMRVGESHPLAYLAMCGGAIFLFMAIMWWSTPYATVSSRYLTVNKNLFSTRYVKLDEIAGVTMVDGNLELRLNAGLPLVFRRIGFSSQARLEAFHALVTQALEGHYQASITPASNTHNAAKGAEAVSALQFFRSPLYAMVTISVALAFGVLGFWLSKQTNLLGWVAFIPMAVGLGQGIWWLRNPYVVIAGEQLTVNNHLLSVKSVMLVHVQDVNSSQAGELKIRYQGTNELTLKTYILGSSKTLDGIRDLLSTKVGEAKRGL